MLKLLSLFSGIGGLDLAARWAGIETVGFCEIDPFCRRVLGKHWPGVWIHDDVRTITAELVRERCGAVDIIAGGFPCQDISTAGKGEGLEGARSGLWFEMLRVISAIRPAWVVAENVPALRTRGIDTVTSGLEAEGYTVAAPMVVGAWAVGAPHRRDRVWIVAHAERAELDRPERTRHGRPGFADESSVVNTSERGIRCGRRSGALTGTGSEGRNMVNPEGDGCARAEDERPREASSPIEADFSRADGMGDPGRFGGERWGVTGDLPCAQGESQADGAERERLRDAIDRSSANRELADSDSPGRREQRGSIAVRPEHSALERPRLNRWPARPGEQQHEWEAPRIIESGVGDSVNGVSRRLVRDRTAKLKALGNAVVPHVVYPIFEAIARLEAGA